MYTGLILSTVAAFVLSIDKFIICKMQCYFNIVSNIYYVLLIYNLLCVLVELGGVLHYVFFVHVKML